MAKEQEKTRYSDEELQEFKNIILEKIEVAKTSYDQLMQRIQTDESRNSFNMLRAGWPLLAPWWRRLPRAC